MYFSLLTVPALDRIAGLSNGHLILPLRILLKLPILSLGWRPRLGHTKDLCYGNTWLSLFGRGHSLFGWMTGLWAQTGEVSRQKNVTADRHIGEATVLRGVRAVPRLCVIHWHSPYNWGRITENHQSIRRCLAEQCWVRIINSTWPRFYGSLHWPVEPCCPWLRVKWTRSILKRRIWRTA